MVLASRSPVTFTDPLFAAAPPYITRVFSGVLSFMIVAAVDVLDRSRQFVGVGIVKRDNRGCVEDAAQASCFPCAKARTPQVMQKSGPC
jgi:hypothetical protein